MKNEIKKAISELKAGVIDGTRGIGCGSIVMADGRCFHVEQLIDNGVYREALVEYRDGERMTYWPEDVSGDVDGISWTCDELGGIYF